MTQAMLDQSPMNIDLCSPCTPAAPAAGEDEAAEWAHFAQLPDRLKWRIAAYADSQSRKWECLPDAWDYLLREGDGAYVEPTCRDKGFDEDDECEACRSGASTASPKTTPCLRLSTHEIDAERKLEMDFEMRLECTTLSPPHGFFAAIQHRASVLHGTVEEIRRRCLTTTRPLVVVMTGLAPVCGNEGYPSVEAYDRSLTAVRNRETIPAGASQTAVRVRQLADALLDLGIVLVWNDLINVPIDATKTSHRSAYDSDWAAENQAFNRFFILNENALQHTVVELSERLQTRVLNLVFHDCAFAAHPACPLCAAAEHAPRSDRSGAAWAGGGYGVRLPKEEPCRVDELCWQMRWPHIAWFPRQRNPKLLRDDLLEQVVGKVVQQVQHVASLD